jgi:acetolactate synthase small subunit
MVNEISLTARLTEELRTIRSYRDAVKSSRRFSAKSQKNSPVATREITHEERLERVKKMVKDSERRRKYNDEIQALLASFRTRRADIKPRPVQKNQVVVNVPAGSSVVLVFN